MVVEPGVIDGHLRGGERELGVAAVLFPAGGVVDVIRQVGNRATSAAIRVGNVSASNRVIRPDAAPTLEERRPGRLEVAAERGHHAHARHDDTTHERTVLSTHDGPAARLRTRSTQS